MKSVTPPLQDFKNERALIPSLFAIAAMAFLLLGPTYLPRVVVLMVLGVGPAVYMTIFLRRDPTALRSRTGSLVLAKALVAFMWLVAIGCVVGYGLGMVR